MSMFTLAKLDPSSVTLNDDNNVDVLLVKHRDAIEELKLMLSDLDLSVSHGLAYDDIFFLRYILSRKTPEAAEEKARKCIEYRTEHGERLDNLKLPYKYDVVRKYMKYSIHKFTKEGDAVLVARLGISDESTLFEHVDPDDFYQYMIDTNELGYRLLDAYTRETRRITKMVFIGDYTDNKFQLNSKSRAIATAQGKASQFSDFMYPQLIRKTVMVNLPSVMVGFWKIVKNFFSAKIVEKLAIISADKLAEDPMVCELIDNDSIPSFWGGNCHCKGGCIPGTPNASMGPTLFPNEEGFYKFNVASRSSKVVSEPVEAGMTIEFEASLDGYNCPFSAAFVAEGSNIEDAVEIHASEIISHSDGPVSSEWPIEKDGCLVITFNNTDSYFRSKDVTMKLGGLQTKGELMKGELAPAAEVKNDAIPSIE